MRLTVIAFALCLLTGSLAAEIYRYEDENGNVVFTDRPMRNAKPVEAEVQNTYTEPTTPPAATPAGRPAETEQETVDTGIYESLNVTSPGNDEPVRDNAGNVTVRAESVPPLRAGHVAVLVMDGTPVLSTRSLVFALENVDRGTHTVSVRIQSSAGETVAESPDSVFHLQRYSRLQGAQN